MQTFHGMAFLPGKPIPKSSKGKHPQLLATWTGGRAFPHHPPCRTGPEKTRSWPQQASPGCRAPTTASAGTPTAGCVRGSSVSRARPVTGQLPAGAPRNRSGSRGPASRGEPGSGSGERRRSAVGGSDEPSPPHLRPFPSGGHLPPPVPGFRALRRAPSLRDSTGEAGTGAGAWEGGVSEKKRKKKPQPHTHTQHRPTTLYGRARRHVNSYGGRGRGAAAVEQLVSLGGCRCPPSRSLPSFPPQRGRGGEREGRGR